MLAICKCLKVELLSVYSVKGEYMFCIIRMDVQFCTVCSRYFLFPIELICAFIINKDINVGLFLFH